MMRSSIRSRLPRDSRPLGDEWDPSKLAGRIMDLDASQGITVTGDNKVISWVDTVGGLNFAQATDVARPDYLATWRNGKPAVDFNGTPQVLQLVLAAQALQAAGRDLSILIVSDLDVVNDGTFIDFNAGRLWCYVAAATVPLDAGWYDTNYRKVGTSYSAGAHALALALDHGGNGVIQEDGVVLGSPASFTGNGLGGTSAVGRHATAALSYLNGRIARLILVDSLLDAAELALFNAWASAEFAL